MKQYDLAPIEKKLAKELIIEHHYSHKWTSCRYALGLFHNEELVGVAVYGFPVGRRVVKSVSELLENNEVLELTRLWVADSEGKNTESYFLGQTFKWLRANAPDVKVLISYSDPMYGHVGTIYQATNWLYQGNNTMLVKGWLHYVNGEWLHPRSCVAQYGTTTASKLLEVDPHYERVEMKKKHRYLYMLDRKSKKNILRTLKHPVLPYPQDNEGCEWRTDSEHIKEEE